MNGNGILLAGGIVVTMIGMGWLSRLDGDSVYLTGVAPPMITIGIGQGAALSPLTAAGISGRGPDDAGAASGLVNVAHQLGCSLGLGILVAVFANAATEEFSDADVLAYRGSVSLSAATAMLAVALLFVWMLIVRPAARRQIPNC